MKPPGNSILKTQPPEIQAALYDRMTKGTTREALAWLKETHGVSISEGRANEFFSWYASTRLLRESDTAARQFEEWAAEQLPGMSALQIADLGQRAFLALALKDSDPEKFATFLHTLAKLEKLSVERERLKLAEAKLADAKKIVESGEAAETVAEKLAKLFAPSS